MASIPVRSLDDLGKVGNCRADLVELRLDYMNSLESITLDLIEEYRPKLILTVREPLEGGVNSFAHREKLDFLGKAVEKGFLVDVEGEFASKHGFECTGQIVSRHFLDREPLFSEMAGFVEKFSGIAAISKLAVKAGENSRYSLIRLLGKYKNIAVMEADGESSSRLLFSILGSKLLYCHEGEKTSPGQLRCDEAVGIMDFLRSSQ